jgi:hypothetical protein
MSDLGKAETFSVQFNNDGSVMLSNESWEKLIDMLKELDITMTLSGKIEIAKP